MSKRLQQIKDEYAQKHHAHDWVSFINDQVHWWVDIQMDEVCKIYAKECMENSLKLASYSANITYEDTRNNEIHRIKFYYMDGNKLIVNRDSIANQENVILL